VERSPTGLKATVGLPLLVALLLAALGCAAPAPTHTAHGVLLSVESPSLQKVDRFTLRTDDGQELDFVAAPDFNQGAAHLMTPGHMRQHMALAEPMTVTYREEGSQLVALNAIDG
jgi:hypothetical protein